MLTFLREYWHLFRLRWFGKASTAYNPSRWPVDCEPLPQDATQIKEWYNRQVEEVKALYDRQVKAEQDLFESRLQKCREWREGKKKNLETLIGPVLDKLSKR